MPHVPPRDDHTPDHHDTTPTWRFTARDALVDPNHAPSPPRRPGVRRPPVVPPRGVWGPLPADSSPLIDKDEN
jgi:hypothetical protein